MAITEAQYTTATNLKTGMEQIDNIVAKYPDVMPDTADITLDEVQEITLAIQTVRATPFTDARIETKLKERAAAYYEGIKTDLETLKTTMDTEHDAIITAS